LAFFAIDTTTNTVITTDFSDERYFLNNSSYLSGSKPNTDNPNNIRSMKKTLVATIVENVLNTIGSGTYATVINKLDSMYNCKLLDCYDHPEYLKGVLVLQGTFTYNSSISSIKSKLHEFEYDEEIGAFLQELSK
ncbi:MAG TPA: hypothetical protein VFG24_03900, partial [Nitrosopumilaceae archaeon]|nr:hypothetical protein [Nitrosopumilaceae archaeon]